MIRVGRGCLLGSPAEAGSLEEERENLYTAKERAKEAIAM